MAQCQITVTNCLLTYFSHAQTISGTSGERQMEEEEKRGGGNKPIHVHPETVVETEVLVT